MGLQTVSVDQLGEAPQSGIQRRTILQIERPIWLCNQWIRSDEDKVEGKRGENKLPEALSLARGECPRLESLFPEGVSTLGGSTDVLSSASLYRI